MEMLKGHKRKLKVTTTGQVSDNWSIKMNNDGNGLY